MCRNISRSENDATDTFSLLKHEIKMERADAMSDEYFLFVQSLSKHEETHNYYSCEEIIYSTQKISTVEYTDGEEV